MPKVDTKDDHVVCDECKLRGTNDDNIRPKMLCNHPEARRYGYIIKWDMDEPLERRPRISTKCPMRGESP